MDVCPIRECGCITVTGVRSTAVDCPLHPSMQDLERSDHLCASILVEAPEAGCLIAGHKHHLVIRRFSDGEIQVRHSSLLKHDERILSFVDALQIRTKYLEPAQQHLKQQRLFVGEMAI